MRHSASVLCPIGDLLQREGGRMEGVGKSREEGGLSFKELPSEHTELLGLSTELILGPFLLSLLE